MTWGPIPRLTEDQHHELQEYIEGHQEDETYSLNPLNISRVLSGDKRGGYINPIYSLEEERGDPDEYLPELFERLELPARKIDDVKGYHVARTEWRLDLLPTKRTPTDAYHRRCGVFYGYPANAVEHFINETIKVTHRDMIRAGILDAEEVAYLTFVPYTYQNSLEKSKILIEEGKRIRRRFRELSREWMLPELETYAEEVYLDFKAGYSGEGGTFPIPMAFPPDREVTPDDVEPLLSEPTL